MWGVKIFGVCCRSQSMSTMVCLNVSHRFSFTTAIWDNSSIVINVSVWLSADLDHIITYNPIPAGALVVEIFCLWGSIWSLPPTLKDVDEIRYSSAGPMKLQLLLWKPQCSLLPIPFDVSIICCLRKRK